MTSWSFVSIKSTQTFGHANTSDLRSQSHIQVTRKTLDGMSTRSALHWAWALKVLGHLLIYGHMGIWALRN